MVQVSIQALVNAARSGCVVSFPTDTVPALAVQPNQAELIFEVKQRSQDKPLILMGAKPDDLWPYCVASEEEKQIWREIAHKYWPGALTLVLPASDRIPPAINPLDPTTIGVRVPNSAIACQILAQTGPLATTSANLSGQPPLSTMAEIEAVFPHVLTLAPTELQSINPESGVPSTVAKWTSKGWQILRQGAINLET
jgi:L-threonylcarbamoyladenylate synthase